jgi:tol-pal system protein YbgF
MKRDVIRVEEKVIQLRAENRETRKIVARLDSLLSSEAEESVRLRAEIRSSISDLLEQFRMMQANLNDLQDKVNYMSQSGTGQMVVIQPGDTSAASDTTGGEQIMPGINCQELYDESFINIRRGQYEEAIKGFTDYLQYCGTQELADNARFWIGESYYSMEKYKEAIREFDELNKSFSSSEKRPGALYKMARSYEELGQKNEAITTFQKLVDEYPGTLEAEQAKEKLNELK